MLYELGASCWIFWSAVTLGLWIVNCSCAKGGPTRRKPRKVGNSAESLLKDVNSQRKSLKPGPPNVGPNAAKNKPIEPSHQKPCEKEESKASSKKEKSDKAPEDTQQKTQTTQLSTLSKSKMADGTMKTSDITQLTKEENSVVKTQVGSASSRPLTDRTASSKSKSVLKE